MSSEPNLQPFDKGQYQFLLRMLLKTHFDKEAMAEEHLLYNGKTRRMDQMMDHAKEMSKNVLEIEVLRILAQRVRDVAPEITDQLVFRRCSQMFTNQFAIEGKCAGKSSFNETIGIGLYIEGGVLDHSCTPNTCRVFDGLNLQIRAIKHIDTKKEAISVSYIVLTMSREERRAILAENFYFTCNCHRCASHNDANLDFGHYHSLRSNVLALIRNGKNLEASVMLEKLIPMAQEMHGQNGPSITEMLWSCIELKLRAFKQRSCHNLHLGVKLLIKRFHAAVLISHGKEHSFYAFASGLLKRDGLSLE